MIVVKFLYKILLEIVTLVVLGAGERYPAILPEIPPPPTYSPGKTVLYFYVLLH